jgi:hypothetical protein
MFDERKAVTAVESSTQVVLGGTRGGPDVSTLRQDRWWLQPVITVSILTSFVIYATWAAFQGVNYFVGGRKELKWTTDIGYALVPVGDFNNSGEDWLSDGSSTTGNGFSDDGQWVLRTQFQLLF